jgi:hypothetical protein
VDASAPAPLAAAAMSRELPARMPLVDSSMPLTTSVQLLQVGRPWGAVGDRVRGEGLVGWARVAQAVPGAEGCGLCRCVRQMGLSSLLGLPAHEQYGSRMRHESEWAAGGVLVGKGSSSRGRR